MIRVVLAAVVLALTAGCGAPAPAGAPPEAASPAPADLTAVSVEVPSIRASSSLVALGKNPDGTLTVPPVSEPGQASWWDGSGAPGVAGRPAVILGHINGDKRWGVFAHVAELVKGAKVILGRSDGTKVTYSVYRTERYDKGKFPWALVAGDTATPEVRLISCIGHLSHYRVGSRLVGSYDDNIVIFAREA